MIANYTPSKIVTSTEYSIEFIRKDTSGFSFPCDSTGKLHELNPEAQKNYEWCLEHPEEFDVKFIQPDDTIREATIPYVKPLVADWDLIQSLA